MQITLKVDARVRHYVDTVTWDRQPIEIDIHDEAATVTFSTPSGTQGVRLDSATLYAVAALLRDLEDHR